MKVVSKHNGVRYLEIILIIAAVALLFWVMQLRDNAKEEARITEPAREAARETSRLRQQVEAEQRAAAHAQAEANAAIAKAIEHRRATFYTVVFKPWNLKWGVNGIHFKCGIHIRTKSEVNVFVGAWRSYLIRSNPCRVPIEWEDYARMVKAKFNFTKIERFGLPNTELEAAQALERIQVAALAASIRAVTRYRYTQLHEARQAYMNTPYDEAKARLGGEPHFTIALNNGCTWAWDKYYANRRAK
jgi:hypothetical protein